MYIYQIYNKTSKIKITFADSSLLRLHQFGDLPLFFYNPEFKVETLYTLLPRSKLFREYQMLKFEAEKFCARMSLNLGFDSMELAEIFLGKFLQSRGLRGVVTNSTFIWHMRLKHNLSRSRTSLVPRDGNQLLVKRI
jgi:hypothetical protein